MTREEIAESLKLLKEQAQKSHNDTAILNVKIESFVWVIESAIQALSQEPCTDAVSREAVMKIVDEEWICNADYDFRSLVESIENLPSVTQKSGKCKNCKYFEYDSVAKVDGIPLIVAHEICNKWGNGCKTSEDGYCYLFEPQERSD